MTWPATCVGACGACGRQTLDAFQRVIAALAKNTAKKKKPKAKSGRKAKAVPQVPVPYEDCALTTLLRPHLQRETGDRLHMIGTPSPADSHYANNMRTMRTLDRFRRVATWPGPRPNANVELAEGIESEIRRLKKHLDVGTGRTVMCRGLRGLVCTCSSLACGRC